MRARRARDRTGRLRRGGHTRRSHRQVYVPERRGSLQPEMIAATREYDRLAVVLDPSVDALLHEVAAGNPVLVLQNLGVESVPLWHYAVVVGFDSGTRLLSSSGPARTPARRTSARRFTYSWTLARNWAVVVVRPDVIPVTASAASFLAAAAGLEAAHRNDAALAAYRGRSPTLASRHHGAPRDRQRQLRRGPLGGGRSGLSRVLALART